MIGAGTKTTACVLSINSFYVFDDGQALRGLRSKLEAVMSCDFLSRSKADLLRLQNNRIGLRKFIRLTKLDQL